MSFCVTPDFPLSASPFRMTPICLSAVLALPVSAQVSLFPFFKTLGTCLNLLRKTSCSGRSSTSTPRVHFFPPPYFCVQGPGSISCTLVVCFMCSPPTRLQWESCAREGAFVSAAAKCRSLWGACPCFPPSPLQKPGSAAVRRQPCQAPCGSLSSFCVGALFLWSLGMIH